MSNDGDRRSRRAGLPDLQKSKDERGIEIDQVGVSNVRYPLTLPLRDGGEFSTVANLAMGVNLPHDQKGTHMSRFMIALNEQNHHFRPDTAHIVLEELLRFLDAEEAFLDMEFPIFLARPAPVSGVSGLLDYNCVFRTMMTRDGTSDMLVAVRVKITTCCPCSKEVSAHGAHNQRSEVSIDVRPAPGRFIWFEDLIDIGEASSSAPLYPILKRPDEKHITEQAYEHPKFVEDVVRDIAAGLYGMLRAGKIVWFYAASNNYESIHSHDAFAKIERGVRGPLLDPREAAETEALL